LSPTEILGSLRVEDLDSARTVDRMPLIPGLGKTIGMPPGTPVSIRDHETMVNNARARGLRMAPPLPRGSQKCVGDCGRTVSVKRGICGECLEDLTVLRDRTQRYASHAFQVREVLEADEQPVRVCACGQNDFGLPARTNKLDYDSCPIPRAARVDNHSEEATCSKSN